jgi:Protein of unknown function (DUF1822)
MNASLTIDDLSLIYPEQLLLEFSISDRDNIWQQIQNQNYSNSTTAWNAYLNCLCLKTFLSYLKTEPDIKSPPKIWTQETDFSSFWQVVNGSCIEIDKTRLILIPSENSELTELRVQREWVDIPNWNGDYYLAVEICLEKCWMRICGYATYQQLKEEGRYDSIDETYSLDAEELIEDLTIMWTMRDPNSSKKIELEALPILSVVEAETLLKQLSQPSPYSPRLNLPFEQWKALIAQDIYRKKLYEMQQLKSQKETIGIAATVTNLGQWLQNIFEFGWQSIDTLVNSSSGNLAYSFRQGIPSLTQGTIEAAKIISVEGRSLMLLIGLKIEDDENISVFVQLFSLEVNLFLPPNIKLIMLSKLGKVLQEVEAREEDNIIQLKRFTGAKGKSFSIQLSLNDFSAIESFTI